MQGVKLKGVLLSFDVYGLSNSFVAYLFAHEENIMHEILDRKIFGHF